jgi:hypothetical protein
MEMETHIYVFVGRRHVYAISCRVLINIGKKLKIS